MLIFADAELVSCLIQFGVVGFFLFLSFISWVIKQVGAQNAAKGSAQQLSPRGAVIPTQSDPDAASYDAEVLDARVASDPEKHRLESTLSTKGPADHAAQQRHLDDRPIEKGIHDHFDDSVGQLGDSSDAIHEDPNADMLPEVAVTTGEIIDIFRNPERIREAIVLNEILMRPEERWD